MEVQARPRDGSRDLMVLGVVILIVGIAALAEELAPDLGRYIPLAIGVGLLALFAITRNYAALIFGGIMTGIGTGLAVAQVLALNGQTEGAAVVLGLGLGFYGIWAVSIFANLRERHWWPAIPGTILSVVGVTLAFDAFDEPFVGGLVLVGIGVVIIAFGALRTLTVPKTS